MSRSAVAIDTSQLQRWGGLIATEIVDIARRVEGAVDEQQSDDVFVEAVTRVPVLTGVLRGTIRQTGRGLTRRVRAGGARAFYARYQEYGTRHHAAQPFLMTQADAAGMQAFERRVAQALAKGAIYR